MKKPVVVITVLLLSVSLFLGGCVPRDLQVKSTAGLLFQIYHNMDDPDIGTVIEKYVDGKSFKIVPDSVKNSVPAFVPVENLDLLASGKVVSVLLRKTMEHIEWKVTAPRKISATEMAVRAKVTNLDMQSMITKIALAVVKFELANLFTSYTDEERIDEYAKIVETTLSENRDLTKAWEIEVHLTKAGRLWQPDLSADVLNAMTGGLYNLIMWKT